MATKKTAQGHQRQGDVFLLRLSETPTGLAPAPKDPRGLVLADGESSGHFHQVFGRGSKLMRYADTTNASRVLVVGRAGAEVRVVGGEAGGVPRHHVINLSPGAWEVRLQRSWTGEDEKRSQQVQD